MSLTKNKQYAKKLIEKLSNAPRYYIAYTGLFFYQEVIKAHIEGGLGGFDSGQGALNWRLKYYTKSYQRKPAKKVWGYKYRGRVVRPKSPAGFKTQRHNPNAKKGSKPLVLNYLMEESMEAFLSRPKGFTSFVVYNPITTRFPGFEPGSPLGYSDNVFGAISKATLNTLLKKAEQQAEQMLTNILTGNV